MTDGNNQQPAISQPQFSEAALSDALLKAGGDFQVAARLLGPRITVDEVKLAVAQSRDLLQDLKDYYKVDLLASLAKLTTLMTIEVMQRLSEIPPEQLIKSHSLLTERMLDILDGRFKGGTGSSTIVNQNNIQVDAVLQSLPPELRQRVIDLANQDDTT